MGTRRTFVCTRLSPVGNVLQTERGIKIRLHAGRTLFLWEGTSQYEESTTGKALNLKGANYHLQRLEMVPSCFAIVAPLLQAEKPPPMGDVNKKKHNLVIECIFGAQ